MSALTTELQGDVITSPRSPWEKRHNNAIARLLALEAALDREALESGIVALNEEARRWRGCINVNRDVFAKQCTDDADTLRTLAALAE